MTSPHTLIPLRSLSPPSNLCGLPDDRPDFTWAQAINALTLDFNQAICLRAGTALAALADSVHDPPLVWVAGTLRLSARQTPSSRKNVSSLRLKGYV